MRPISKKAITYTQKKGAGGVAQGVGPEFKPQYYKKKKKKKKVDYFSALKGKTEPGKVAHGYNSNYSGGKGRSTEILRPARAKGNSGPPISKTKRLEA
jgi:hypothetical protein